MATLKYIVHSQLERYRILHSYIDSKKLLSGIYGYIYQDQEVNLTFLKNPNLDVQVVTYAAANFEIDIPKRYQIDISSQEIDRELQKLRVRYGKQEEVETFSTEEKFTQDVYPTFSLIPEEKELNSGVAPLTLEYSQIIENRRGSFFTTKRKGDVLTLQLSDFEGVLPSSWSEQFKDTEKEQQYKIEKISKQTLAVLDDELLGKILSENKDKTDQTYPVSEAGLRSYLEDNLKTSYDQSSDRFFSIQSFDLLVKKNDQLALPEEYLERSYRQYLDGLSSQKSDNRTPLERTDYDREVNKDYVQQSLFNALEVSVDEEEVRSETVKKIAAFIPNAESMPPEQIDEYAQMLKIREDIFQGKLQKVLVAKYTLGKDDHQVLLSQELFQKEIENYNKK